MRSAIVAVDYPGWVVKTSWLSELARNVRRGSEGHGDYRAALFDQFIGSSIRINYDYIVPSAKLLNKSNVLRVVVFRVKLSLAFKNHAVAIGSDAMEAVGQKLIAN